MSDFDTVSYPSTLYSQATSSNPLSVASLNMYDYNNNGISLRSDIAMNWGGTVEGPRHFSVDGTVDQVFSLSTDCDWISVIPSTTSVVAYSYVWMHDLVHGGAPIDLLTASSGSLAAGTYRFTAHASGAWDYSGLSFLVGNEFRVDFNSVPAPGSACLLTAAGAVLIRRRRR